MDVNFLEKLYWNCQRRDKQQNMNVVPKFPEPVLPPQAVNDQSFILWWALWQCAEYTVANKLRTSLGRPQDTFQKIEGNVLAKSAAVCLLEQNRLPNVFRSTHIQNTFGSMLCSMR